MNSTKLLSTAALCLLSMGAKAQTSMRITMEDGKQIDYPVSSIANVTWITNEENPETPDVTPSGVQAVDLGLPSGLKWANMNIGAIFPEDYGDYFAWGEVEPKSTYDWSTYFDNMDDSFSNFKKYYKNGGKTELDLEDDAAYMNWGEGWRMPSDAQWTELRTNCTWTWNSTKKGYTVVGPNKNSLFLPAAGIIYDSSLSYAGSWGNYWSRSLGTSASYVAYGVNFGSGDHVSGCSISRCFGNSVRPVLVSISK